MRCRCALPCCSIPGYKTRYDNVNLVTIRENTEGEGGPAALPGAWRRTLRLYSRTLRLLNRGAMAARARMPPEAAPDQRCRWDLPVAQASTLAWSTRWCLAWWSL